MCVCVYNCYTCLPNYGKHQVETCRLAGLPDLDQSHRFVHTVLKNWAKEMVSEYEFDGLRVDKIHMVPKDFWKEYSQSAGVFTIGEVFTGNPEYLSNYWVMVFVVNSVLNVTEALSE